jgi:copper chaperone CopZ
MHVAKVLKALPGVSDAAVDLSTGSARVSHDGTLADGKVCEAVEKAGYKAWRA